MILYHDILFTFLLIISLVLPVNFTFASQTVGGEQFPQSIIAASSTDTTPHTLELKAVQDEDNAEPRRVSGFKLDMTNVVTAQINSRLLVFVTDSSVKVLEAKVRTVSDRLIDLVPSSQANAFSLRNLPVGFYTLDVMTQKGNTKAAYEGILVISQQPTTVISETTRNIINQEIDQNTRNGDNGDGDDICPPGTIGKPPFCVDCEENPDDPRCPPPDCEADPATFPLFVGMVCRNICERIYSKIVVGQSHYFVGKKYCRRYKCYSITNKVFCQCCGMQLRATPIEKELKEKIRAKKN